MLSGLTLRAQDTATWKPLDFHLSLGTAVVGNSHNAASLFTVTPSLVYRPNERTIIKGSFTTLNSYSLTGGNYALHGREPRSMAPLRYPSSLAAVGTVSLAYKASDRLWIAASLTHVGGELASAAILNPWFQSSRPVLLDATAFTAAMRYKFKNDNTLDLYFTYINDRTGALGPLLFYGPYGNPYYVEHGFSCFYGSPFCP